MVNNLGREIGQVDPHVTITAINIQPAFSLHRDQNRLQPFLRRDIDLFQRARSGNTIRGEPMRALKIAHGHNHCIVIDRRQGTGQIAHTDQTVPQCGHGGAAFARAQGVGRPHLFAPRVGRDHLFKRHLGAQQTRVFGRLRRKRFQEIDRFGRGKTIQRFQLIPIRHAAVDQLNHLIGGQNAGLNVPCILQEQTAKLGLKLTLLKRGGRSLHFRNKRLRIIKISRKPMHRRIGKGRQQRIAPRQTILIGPDPQPLEGPCAIELT